LETLTRLNGIGIGVMTNYQYIVDAIQEEAKVRLQKEPELRNELRAVYAVSTEVDLLVGEIMKKLSLSNNHTS